MPWSIHVAIYYQATLILVASTANDEDQDRSSVAFFLEAKSLGLSATPAHSKPGAMWCDSSYGNGILSINSNVHLIFVSAIPSDPHLTRIQDPSAWLSYGKGILSINSNVHCIFVSAIISSWSHPIQPSTDPHTKPIRMAFRDQKYMSQRPNNYKRVWGLNDPKWRYIMTFFATLLKSVSSIAILLHPHTRQRQGSFVPGGVSATSSYFHGMINHRKI